jgi:hypothetical protein
MPNYRLIKGFVRPEDLEAVIAETFDFKKTYYNEGNLATHTAYLSDDKPHRTSHAYAVTSHSPDRYPEGILNLPYINLRATDDWGKKHLTNLYRLVRHEMGLCQDNRMLFNVQEYYGGSEPVPMHCDGELLEFDVREDGSLNIKRSIRPDYVAVLTLVNDTDAGGTRVHPCDGVDNSHVIRAEAGDLLIFDNVNNFHSVDALNGTVKRPDGLLRMTIGWRSLGDRCHYMEYGRVVPINKAQAELMTEKWYVTEWPKQWEKIQAATQKAAF